MNYKITISTSILCGILMTTQYTMANTDVGDLYQAMDADSDGRVSEKEFLQVWGDLNYQQDQDQDGKLNRAEYSSGVFDSVDTNKDGYVSFEEDRALRKAHFSATDLNKDAWVSYKEFMSVHEAAQPELVQEPDMNVDVQIAQFERLVRLTGVPKLWSADGYEATEKLAAVYYDALDWKGNPTKVFAWLGLPEDISKPVPGIVLVHGGGGTAFKEWLTEWTSRGYAAIAIAVEGQTDVPNPEGSLHSPWEQHEWTGPQRFGIYNDSDQPFEDQWMYHAVANTILANSLLRSLPEVDADQVGMMGISWGGVITSTAIGIDPRFAFAISVYGCGGLTHAQNVYGQALENNEIYKQVLDPLLRMDRVLTPTLWFSWPEDPHFPLDAQASCYERQLGEHMVTLIPEMGHGHGQGWTRPESYAFADSVLAGQLWCRQIHSKVEEDILYVKFEATKELESASLVWTSDSGVTGDRLWNEQDASVAMIDGEWTAWSRIPQGATGYFINITSGDLMVSSDYFDLNQ